MNDSPHRTRFLMRGFRSYCDLNSADLETYRRHGVFTHAPAHLFLGDEDSALFTDLADYMLAWLLAYDIGNARPSVPYPLWMEAKRRARAEAAELRVLSRRPPLAPDHPRHEAAVTEAGYETIRGLSETARLLRLGELFRDPSAAHARLT